jgi:hypothetical protein
MLLKNAIRMSAVGSGKTWGICNEALTNLSNATDHKKILMTTFTIKGIETIASYICEQNLGVLSNSIILRSWFQFLLVELIKPYQSFIVDINTVKSFDFSDKGKKVNFGKIGEKRRYFNPDMYIMKDYASELAMYLIEHSNGEVVNRLEGMYSHIYIDEVQDMAGYDLKIMKALFHSSISVVCVGDNKQATYATHNTRTNKKYSGKKLWDFCAEVEKSNLAKIEESMVSRRFGSNICAFANRVYPNSKNIKTGMTERTEHDGVFLIDRSDIQKYCSYFTPTILKYDKRTDVGDVISLNFGQCKGMTFDRVLIYPNKPLIDFLSDVPLNNPEKYYVAVTRPRYSLVIVIDKPPKSSTFETVTINIGNAIINGYRFVEQ